MTHPVGGEVGGPPNDGDDDGDEGEAGAVAEAEKCGTEGEELGCKGREDREGGIDECEEEEDGRGQEED